MPITIQSPTLISPQANQNYFEALMQKQRIEAAQKQREVEMMHNSVSQGIQNITDPLNRAIQMKYQNDRADKRFDKSADLSRERMAAQLGVTPSDLKSFNQTGKWSPEAIARRNAVSQAKQKVEMQAYQQQQQIKQQQEMQSAELERTAEFAHSGKDPAFTAEWNRLTNQEMAILGDEQFDNQDPNWRQSKLSEINQKKVKLGQKIPKQKSHPEQYSELLIPASEIPAYKGLIESGAVEPGTLFVMSGERNGRPQYDLAPGILSKKEQIELQNATRKIEYEEARNRRAEEQAKRDAQEHERKIKNYDEYGRPTAPAPKDETAEALRWRSAALKSYGQKFAEGIRPDGTYVFKTPPTEDALRDEEELLRQNVEDQKTRAKETLAAKGAGEHYATIKPFIEQAELQRIGDNPSATAGGLMIQKLNELTATKEQSGRSTPEMDKQFNELVAALEAMMAEN